MVLTPYLSDPDLTIYNGDALEVLRELPAESVDCCVTSPPFFGLRDYQVDGQIGLEATPEEWVARLVAVFDQVKRVLRSDGTLWVECGDSYATSPPGNKATGWEKWQTSGLAGAKEGSRYLETLDASVSQTRDKSKLPGLKQKDLLGQPFLLAFALREAGWYWRNVCIWHKPNPMPESVRDRFTVAHSYVLLLSKSPRYFFDAEAVREDYTGPPEFRYGRGGAYQNLAMNGEGDGTTPTSIRGPDGRRKTAVKAGDNSIQHRDGERWPNSGRNARSVWTIPTEPLPFEHYAAFPQALAERCIKAGTSERGCCPECGAPWVRPDWIATPLGSGPTADPTRLTGRAGMNRERRDDEGTRLITRFEQRRYAEQLRNALKADRLLMEAEAGVEAFAHYIRTDKSGARPIPPDLLERWIEDGFIERIDPPSGWHPSCDCPAMLLEYDKPGSRFLDRCTVLDPFLGSGTTALVARRLNRRCIGIELNADYCALAARRTQQLSLEASA